MPNITGTWQMNTWSGGDNGFGVGNSTGLTEVITTIRGV